MRVDKSGHYGLVMRVDHDRVWPFLGQDLFVLTKGQKEAITHSDGFCYRLAFFDDY